VIFTVAPAIQQHPAAAQAQLHRSLFEQFTFRTSLCTRPSDSYNQGVFEYHQPFAQRENMTPLERLAILRNGACAPPQFITEYYGLPWPFENELNSDFQIWRKTLARPTTCGQDSASRYEIEAFMQHQHIVPRKWMAALLGMQEVSFDNLTQRLGDLGLRPQRYLPYDNMAATSLSEDIIPALPNLRFWTFASQNSFCTRLHADIVSALGFVVEPMFCDTSTRIQDYPRQYAKHFDCLTLAPLSVKHTVWLDFRKPLSLGPDRCSKLFYASHRDDLQPFCAGTSEPEDLDIYEQLIAGGQSGGG